MQDTDNNPFESLVFLTNRIGRLLSNRIRKRIDGASAPEMAIHPQYFGLMADLWMKDGMRQQDLAVSVIKDKGTIARSIDAMEKLNLVVRVPDSQDKRNKRIYLTHKGREMKNFLIPHAKAVSCEAISGIKEEDFLTCLRVLAQAYQTLVAQEENE